VTNFSVKVRISANSYEHLLNDSLKSQSPFRPGMSATVDLLTRSVKDVVSIPIQCVSTRKSEDSDDAELGVFLIGEGDEVVWGKVKTGIQDNFNIEIISGLKEGDVIVSGPYDMVSRKLEDGDKVEVKEEEEEEFD
jgi:HlyD family secretion protein